VVTFQVLFLSTPLQSRRIFGLRQAVGERRKEAQHINRSSAKSATARPTAALQLLLEGFLFGTWLLFFHIYIYVYIYGNVIIPTDELIFFRGVGFITTNQ
jgi:membrane protein required for beta-lactamase induction